jgi:imidazolonepropionase-like amidohydrolase
MGTIDSNKVADMVLLDANPLLDISNTRRINLVISKGVVINPEELL